MSDDKKKKLHCNTCGHETWHNQAFQHNITAAKDERYGISWGFNDCLYVCCGCDTVTLSHIDWNSECGDHAEYYYPPRLTRKLPEWIENWKIESEALWLFKEVYSALHNSSNRLATMGIRTLIDICIQNKVGDQGDFQKGLKELLSKGHITSDQKDIISIVVAAGNASAHRSYNPDKETLITVLDIVEHLYQLDVLKNEAQNVKKKTPQRANKQKEK